MSDLISRQAVETAIKEYFKSEVDKLPRNMGFEEHCDTCDLILNHNVGVLKAINDIPTAYDVDNVAEELQQMKARYFLTIANTGNEILDKIYEEVGNSIDKAISISKGAVKDE